MLNDKELETKWVKALRSGEYKQTVGYLHNSSGQCCLGVLCEVAGLERTSIGYGAYEYSYEGDKSDSALPCNFRKEIGMDYYVSEDLMSKNDIRKFTFSQIADFIENGEPVKSNEGEEHE